MQRLTPVRIGAPLAVLVGVGAAWAPNSSANTGSDNRPGVIDMEVTTRDGDTLSLSLDTAQFAAPDFNGTFVFTGELAGLHHTDTVPITIETDAAHVAETLSHWTVVQAENIVMSVTRNNVVTIASFNDDAGSGVHADITSQGGNVSGRVSAEASVNDATEVFATPRATEATSDIVSNVWTYAASVVTGLVVSADEVSFKDCLDAARETCGHNCGNGTGTQQEDQRVCIRSLSYTVDGCSFECYTKAECCADDEK